MQAPQRDSNGTIPHNHPEILSQDNLIRYLRPGIQIHFEYGEWRISSAAFSPSTPASDPRSSVSVDLEKSMCQAGLALPYLLKEQSHAVAGIEAGPARVLGLFVGWDPVPDNIHHCGIWGAYPHYLF